MKQSNDDKLKVYFNSACPVCNAGIISQKSKTTMCSVTWNDVHSDNRHAAEANANIDTVRKYLHVIDGDSNKHIGIDAFIVLWKNSGTEQWKANIATLPIINPIAKVAYFIFANMLFFWNRLMKNWV